MTDRVCRICEKVDLAGLHYNTKFCKSCMVRRVYLKNRQYMRKHRAGLDGKQRGTLRQVAERTRVRLLAWREDDPELAALLDRERVLRGIPIP